MTAARFGANLRRFGGLVRANGTFVVQEGSRALHRSMVQTSPIDTGQLRSSMQVGVDTRPSPRPEDLLPARRGQYPPAQATIDIGNLELRRATIGSVIFVSSFVRHAEINDRGLHRPANSAKVSGGFSTQSPQGMSGPSLVVAHAAVLEAARRARAAFGL